jgi:hypothetical protein
MRISHLLDDIRLLNVCTWMCMCTYVIVRVCEYVYMGASEKIKIETRMADRPCMLFFIRLTTLSC